ncbi:MAG: hypothetical protein Q7T70_09085 [Polaromonas sp.]|nr:hypothetical protein [Polaromonas sp.]
MLPAGVYGVDDVGGKTKRQTARTNKKKQAEACFLVGWFKTKAL